MKRPFLSLPYRGRTIFVIRTQRRHFNFASNRVRASGSLRRKGGVRACVRVTFEQYRGMTVFSLPSSLPLPYAGNRRLRKTMNGSAMQFALHTRAVRMCTRMQGQVWVRVSDARISGDAHVFAGACVPAYVRISRVYCTGSPLPPSSSLSSFVVRRGAYTLVG